MIIIRRSARTADDHQMITRILVDYQRMINLTVSSDIKWSSGDYQNIANIRGSTVIAAYPQMVIIIKSALTADTIKSSYGVFVKI